MSAFGEKIESLRNEKNVTTKDVAQAVGIPQSRYSELEKGIRIPTDGQIERLAEYYNVKPDELSALTK